MFAAAGFAGQSLDIALGVSYAESSGYADAVGDIALVDEKWGPSVGLFQIRSLRDPNAWGPTDRWRVAEKLRDPEYNAKAAFAISRQGTNFTAWTMYRNETYLQFKGRDYEIRYGHKNADKWSA